MEQHSQHMLVLKLRKKGILLTLQMERLPKIIIQMGPTASQLTMTGTRTVVGWSTGQTYHLLTVMLAMMAFSWFRGGRGAAGLNITNNHHVDIFCVERQRT